MLTYRSKGVHTNRKGGKSSRSPVDRDGNPIRKRITKAAKAISDGELNIPQDSMPADAQSDADRMAAAQQLAQQGVPGRAQEIIAKRRV